MKLLSIKNERILSRKDRYAIDRLYKNKVCVDYTCFVQCFAQNDNFPICSQKYNARKFENQ